MNTSHQAATLHGSRIPDEVADFAYHAGTIGFANIWVALGSFAVATGWVLLTSGVEERWLGWWIGAAGVGLVLARFGWTTWLWLLPYGCLLGVGPHGRHPAGPAPGRWVRTAG